MNILENLIKFIANIIKCYFIFWGVIIILIIAAVTKIFEFLIPILIVLGAAIATIAISLLLVAFLGIWFLLLLGLPILIFGAYIAVTSTIWGGMAIMAIGLLCMDTCYMQILLKRMFEQDEERQKTSKKTKTQKDSVAENKEIKTQGIGFIELITYKSDHPNDRINKVLLILQHPTLYQILLFIEICAILILYLIPDIPQNIFLPLRVTINIIGALLLNMLIFLIVSVCL